MSSKRTDKDRERSRRWYQNNKERVKGYVKKYLAERPESRREYYLRHVYGPKAPELVEEKLKAQNGCCAICEQPCPKLCFDHDHKCCSGYRSCGKCLRDLLCGRCNKAIGMFDDDTDLMLKAAAYVVRHRDKLT